MAKDYYKTLGLDKKASKEEIKKAFHKLAHKYHPDKQGGDEAKFKEINEAYQILSDDTKRAQYDQFSARGGSASGWGGFNGGGFNGFDFNNFGQGFSAQDGSASGWEFDLGDIFGEMFGGGSDRAGGGRVKRGRDISIDIQISFKESIFGTERQVLINKNSQCEICHGSGAETGSQMKKCNTCQGKGKVNETRRSIFGVFQSIRECADCAGQGEIAEKKCKHCQGLGILNKQESVKIVVPPGIDHSEMIRLTGKGEAVANGQAGDLYVRVHIEKDKNWKRVGHDLTIELKVKLTDAILGTEHSLETLEGPLTLKIPSGLAYGEILRVKGKGVPITGSTRRGDLLVRVIFPTPAKLSRVAKKAIEDLRQEGI